MSNKWIKDIRNIIIAIIDKITRIITKTIVNIRDKNLGIAIISITNSIFSRYQTFII